MQYVSERFLESFESNVELSLLLDNLELVIVPVLNPDGLQVPPSICVP